MDGPFEPPHTILTILAIHQLSTKHSKWRFGVTFVDYLGHVISEQAVAVDDSKIEAVLAWPVATTTKEVQGFLGLVV